MDVVDKIEQAFRDMQILADYGNYIVIGSKFDLCAPLETMTDYEQLLYVIRNVFAQTAVHNYPYRSSDVNQTVYPVAELSEIVLAANTPIGGLNDALNFYYNQSEAFLHCFDIYKLFTKCSDPLGCPYGSAGVSRSYQVCYELSSGKFFHL